MIKSIPLVLVFGLVVACAEEPPAGYPSPNTNLCPQMCAHLKDLNCPEAESVYSNDLPGPPDVPNETCTDFCVDLQTKGVTMNPKCVLNITSCDGIEPARQLDPNTCK